LEGSLELFGAVIAQIKCTAIVKNSYLYCFKHKHWSKFTQMKYLFSVVRLVCFVFFALSSIAQNDTLLLGDSFFAGVEPTLLAQHEALVNDPKHAAFWTEFNQKFTTDFDVKAQYKQVLKENNADKWEMSLFKTRQTQVDFYKKHAQFSQLSDDFKQLVENQIRYNYWHLLLAFPVIKANADPTLLKIYSLPAIMLEGLDPKKISDEKALLTPHYRHFLAYYIIYFNSKNRQFEKYRNMAASMSDKAALAGKQLSGKVLKYYLTRLMVEYCQNTPADAIKQTLGQLAAQPQSEGHVRVAQAQCAEAMARKEQPVAAAPAKADKSGFELVGLDGNVFNTSELKGKVVYVDFWASWCGPCRKEFPFSKELHAKLTDKQKKKIVFLYISIDENQDAWKKAIETLKLEGVNGWSPMLAGKLNISSIPRYMIWDKDGKIVNPDAQRPSSPAILDELLKLID